MGDSTSRGLAAFLAHVVDARSDGGPADPRVDQLEPQRPPQPVREGGQHRPDDAQERHCNHDHHDGDPDLPVEEIVLQRHQRDSGADEGKQEAQDGRDDVDHEPRPHVLGAKGEHGGQREKKAEGDEHEGAVRQAGRRAGGHRGDEAGSAGGEVDLQPTFARRCESNISWMGHRLGAAPDARHAVIKRRIHNTRAPTCKEPRLMVPWFDMLAVGPMAQLSATALVDEMTCVPSRWKHAKKHSCFRLEGANKRRRSKKQRLKMQPYAPSRSPEPRRC